MILSRLQVGLANVGKSTLFQAITKCQLGNPANFPYATIDPEEARVVVPDERYDWLCEHYKVFSPLVEVFRSPWALRCGGELVEALRAGPLSEVFLSTCRARVPRLHLFSSPLYTVAFLCNVTSFISTIIVMGFFCASAADRPPASQLPRSPPT